MRDRYLVVAILLWAATSLACARRYEPGDTYAIVGIGQFYVNERAYRDAVDRTRAKIATGFAETHGTGSYYLKKEVHVRIVEEVDGGARVAVVDGDFAGMVGWMLDEELGPGQRKKKQ